MSILFECLYSFSFFLSFCLNHKDFLFLSIFCLFISFFISEVFSTCLNFVQFCIFICLLNIQKTFSIKCLLERIVFFFFFFLSQWQFFSLLMELSFIVKWHLNFLYSNVKQNLFSLSNMSNYYPRKCWQEILVTSF